MPSNCSYIRFARWLAIGLIAFGIGSDIALSQEHLWQSLIPAIDPNKHAIAGTWKKMDTGLSVTAAEGSRLTLPVTVGKEYNLRIGFTRRSGQHSIGVIVVHNGHQVAFEVDAWAMHLAGFQNVDGKSMREKSTSSSKFELQNNRRYSLTVEVRKDHLRGLLDGKEIASHATDGRNLSLPDLWSLPNRESLGLLAWDSETTFHRVEIQSVGDEPVRIGGPSPTTLSSSNASTKLESPTANAPKANRGDLKAPDVAKSGTGKHVLIIIANHHFFYREYGEPREELERAGIRVTVAAGRKEVCRPHANSGEPSNGGEVFPDLTLSEVKASDYDAVLFSGGWGASMYQYAFQGRYNDPVYNGNPAIKRQANRIVNEFLEQKKYLCALCNATSVLAWARVDGKSPLAGRRVCAPQREAPAGLYNGRPAQPPCRWHAEVNGAKLSPPGAIGQANTAADDVVVDEYIITAEDDISAREMGRRIVAVLTK